VRQLGQKSLYNTYVLVEILRIKAAAYIRKATRSTIEVLRLLNLFLAKRLFEDLRMR